MPDDLEAADGKGAVLAVPAQAGHDAFLAAAAFSLAAMAVALLMMPRSRASAAARA